MMTYEQMEDLFKQRNLDLAQQGYAGEFDGPVSQEIQDDLLADFRKDLMATFEEMQEIPKSK